MAHAASHTRFCAICQDAILQEAPVSKLNCNHEYHRDCLQPWLESHHNTCPIDRVRITSINSVEISLSEETNSYFPEVENPLVEARALYQQSIRVIQNPSIHSSDPLERQAARVSLIANCIFGSIR